MNRTITRWRRHTAVVIVTVTAALVAVAAAAVPAKAEGVTPGQLTAAGWTCIQPLDLEAPGLLSPRRVHLEQ